MSSLPSSGGSSPTVHVVTIAARNYLPRVRILAESFHRHHPGGVFDICVVDDRTNTVDLSDEGIGVIGLHELDLDPVLLRQMALFYDVTEFATALKPWVMEAGQRRVPGPVLYLDPDIEIFGPLDELVALADQHGIVLTPHVLEPIPRDGLTPPETHIMRAGMYNLGFIGVGADCGGMLDWWQERLVTDAVSAPEIGLFTDQKWIDFVPSLFPYHLHRDPGCNVAYWNLHERPLTRSDDGLLRAGGSPLVFLHYSGYDPTAPHVLSKYAGDLPRVRFSAEPVLSELCARYGERLDAIVAESGELPSYGWERLDNGLLIDGIMRRLAREAVQDALAGEGEGPPDVAAPGGTRAFMDWLLEPTGRRSHPRNHDRLLLERHDVDRAFPDIVRGDTTGFRSWLRINAIDEVGLSPRMVAELDRVVAGWEAEAARPPHPGAHPFAEVIGVLRAELGVGEAARRTAGALSAAGVPHRTTGWYAASRSRATAAQPDSSLDLRGDSDIALVHLNADVFGQVVADLGRTHLEGRYTVGVWFWELEEFPSSLWPAFDLVDEVWVATEFMQRSIGANSPVPVVHMPVPLFPPPVAPGLSRTDLGLDDRFTFLFVFDHFSILDRKNPLGLIEAYTAAFGPDDGARLVIKTINGERRVLDHERMVLAAAGRPDIELRDGYMAPDEVGALLAAADCYVSLHRAEGLGLTIAESMALGKPAIVTDYAGSTDFVHEGVAYPVPFELVEVGDGNDPYEPQVHWADPDLEVASKFMRGVFEHPEEAAIVGARARVELHDRFSAEVCGRRMAVRLDRIRRDR
ncbi:MAG TPA: glycosyltransferase, partial [Acidimicrobiales bacterium]